MNSITQDMKYRQSLLTYVQKYGVSRASRKYNKSRSYIYFWRAATTVPCNPWPANPDVLIATPTNIPQRSSNSSLICTDEIPSWELWSYGRGCENEGIHEPWRASGG